MTGILLPQMFIKTGAAVAPPATIQATLASNVIDLDATLSASYSGSGQTWANYCPTPADGSAKALYDFYLGDTSGATTADPTFTGTAGNPAAYFALDGGDYFTLKSGTGGPDFLTKLHREDVTQPVTIVMAMRYADNGAVQNVCGNNSSSSTAHAGHRLRVTTSDFLELNRNTGDASSTNNSFTSTAALVNSADTLVAFTLQSNTRAWKASKNGTSFTSSGTGTTLTNNNVTAVDTFSIGAANKAVPLASGSRISAFSMFNSILSDADLVALASIYETRHARLYH
jgi:hypothetical protein